jgi:hypothetical protein
MNLNCRARAPFLTRHQLMTATFFGTFLRCQQLGWSRRGFSVLTSPASNARLVTSAIAPKSRRRLYSEHAHNEQGSSNGGHSGWRRRFNTFVGPDPAYTQWSARWWADFWIKMLVFAVTGSSTAYLVRPLVSQHLGLNGSFKDGPWSYRIVSLIVMMPGNYAALEMRANST